MVGYFPIKHLVAHKCLGFIFQTKDDVIHILKGCWLLDKNLLSMKLWHFLLDAQEKFVTSILESIKLTLLPLEFWYEN